MKYTVVVNQKYMIKVEANSLLGAEHMALDLHGGIKGAQAFDQEGMKTETFEYFLNNCEFCSLNELKAKTKEYELFEKSVEFYEYAIAEREKDIKKHLAIIEELKKGNEADKDALINYRNKVNTYWD